MRSVEDRQRCPEAGRDGYLSKPIRTSELFAAIEGLAVAGRETD
jgi:CheY-like chemotaxis protein